MRKELRPGLAIVAVTLAVELGVFFLARFADLGLRESVVAALMAAAVWTALAAPVLAAGAKGALRSLIRAGLVADATFATLLILWLFWNFSSPRREEMTFVSVLEVYCVYAAMTVLAAGAVCCSRRVAGRYTVAAATAAAMMLALASPLWTGGLIVATEGSTREIVAGLTVWLNPFYSITSALIDPLRYVIHQESVMYRLTLIGDYVAPPPCPWFAAVAIYMPLGLLLLGAGKLVHRTRD